MGRKIGFGILWFIAIYLGSCMVIAAIAGGIAGSKYNDSQSSYLAGKEAGASVVIAWRPYLLFGATFIAVTGAIKGFLPGTKQKSVDSNNK